MTSDMKMHIKLRCAIEFVQGKKNGIQWYLNIECENNACIMSSNNGNSDVYDKAYSGQHCTAISAQNEGHLQVCGEIMFCHWKLILTVVLSSLHQL